MYGIYPGPYLKKNMFVVILCLIRYYLSMFPAKMAYLACWDLKNNLLDRWFFCFTQLQIKGEEDYILGKLKASVEDIICKLMNLTVKYS